MMTRYLIHVPSGRYLQPNGSWNESRDRALVFADAFTAIRYCVREDLGNAELLLHFDDAEEMDLHISLKSVAHRN
jgi:hypothetical protein